MTKRLLSAAVRATLAGRVITRLARATISTAAKKFEILSLIRRLRPRRASASSTGAVSSPGTLTTTCSRSMNKSRVSSFLAAGCSARMRVTSSSSYRCLRCIPVGASCIIPIARSAAPVSKAVRESLLDEQTSKFSDGASTAKRSSKWGMMNAARKSGITSRICPVAVKGSKLRPSRIRPIVDNAVCSVGCNSSARAVRV